MRASFRAERAPESGGRSPARICSSVDLPEPLGPMRPRRSPSARLREISWNSGRAPKETPMPEATRRTGACRSLIAEGLHRVEAGGFDRGPDAEEQADSHGDREAGDQRPTGNLRGQGRHQFPYQKGDEHGDDDAQDTTRAGEGHGFHQELAHDIAAAGPHGLAHAAFAR